MDLTREEKAYFYIVQNFTPEQERQQVEFLGYVPLSTPTDYIIDGSVLINISNVPHLKQIIKQFGLTTLYFTESGPQFVNYFNRIRLRVRPIYFRYIGRRSPCRCGAYHKPC